MPRQRDCHERKWQVGKDYVRKQYPNVLKGGDEIATNVRHSAGAKMKNRQVINPTNVSMGDQFGLI
jgi:hypothetical protein